MVAFQAPSGQAPEPLSDGIKRRQAGPPAWRPPYPGPPPPPPRRRCDPGAPFLEELQHGIGREPGPVGTVLGHGLENGRHPQDAGLPGHGVHGQVEGVAAAVRLLVVVGGPGGDFLEAPDAVQDLVGLEAVGVDHLAFPLVELARLVQHLVGHPQLAQVVQQAGDFQALAVGLGHPHGFGQMPGQTGDAEGMLGSEGALGIDDAGEDAGQLLQLGQGGAAGLALGQHVLQGGLDAPGLQAKPEGLGGGGLEKGFHQFGGEEGAGAVADFLADGRRLHEHVAAAVVGRGQGIHPVHQENQVGLLGHLAGDVGPPLQVLPVGVVVMHRLGHGGQGPEVPQQLAAHVAVLLGHLPVEFADQMVVGAGGGNADVVQQPQVEEKGGVAPVQPHDPGAGRRHDAHPLAVGHVVDAHQVEGVGKGVDDLTQVHIDVGGSNGRGIHSHPCGNGTGPLSVHDALVQVS